MISCVNCGRKDAMRKDDTFRCGTCGFEWDVAHEQKNATYIRSALRREPAKPMGDIEMPSLQERLLQAMTPDELRELAASEDIDLGKATQKAEIIAVILQAREPEKTPEGDSEAGDPDSEESPDGDPLLEQMTVQELRDVAAAEAIDLGDATKKAELIAVIVETRATREG